MEGSRCESVRCEASECNKGAAEMSRQSHGGAEVNIALVGAIGSGKSALTVKYITKRFINEYDPFLEDTYAKCETIDNQDVTVRVMDTCDKSGVDPERYLKWADAYLVVYSITDPHSFETAGRYLDAISNHLRSVSSYETPMILVGNKADLERYRQVSAWDGKRLAGRHEASFFETSAAEGEAEAVAGVFREATRQVLKEQERPLFIEESAMGAGQRRSVGEGGVPKGRKDGFAVLSSNTRFSFLKGIVPLKGIFQSTGNGGPPSPAAASSTSTT